MTAFIESLIPFQELVNQCWGILKQSLSATFPSSSRSRPAARVLIQPGGVTYPGDFWQGAIVPILSDLLRVTPPYEGGWTNGMARVLVAGYLRRGLGGSEWEVWIDFTR